MSLDFASDFSDALSTLQGIWIQMGLEDDETTKEKFLLEQEIKNVFSNFVDSTAKRCHLMEQEIDDTIVMHTNLLRAFKYNDEDIKTLVVVPSEGTLKKRLQDVKNKYNKFHLKCEKQILTFSSLQKQIDPLFSQLGITDKGEFTESDELDYSDERLERFQNKVKELKAEVKSRREVLNLKKTEVHELLGQLGESMPSDIISLFDSDNITDKSFSNINKLISSLEREKEKRIKEMSEIANEITRLWDILQVKNEERQRFLQSHSTLSNSEIESCKSELHALHEIRNSRLPELIEIQKQQIAAIQFYLQSDGTVPSYDEADQERAFLLYEDELIKLEAEKKRISPIIDLIGQREELINEYNELQKSVADANKMQGKKAAKPIDIKKQNKDEQAKRRIKSLLPRLEKKLLLLLIEYKDDNGEDLFWRGDAYIQHLQHIILSDVEINRSKKHQRKKSMQPKKEICCLIGDKSGAIRRFSENNRMLVNF